MSVRQKCHLPPNLLSSKYFRKERKRNFTKFGLWLFFILGIFCPFTTRPACALKIVSQMKHYHVGKDSSVTLNCEFSLPSENLQHTEIEWNIVPPNREDDKIIIWLTGGMLYNDLYDPLKGRVHFTSPDPQNGDASLTIKDLRLTDTGTYQCKVKKLPEVDIKNIILTVMERPSKPVCHLEGEATAGKRVVLKCRSSQGTPPLRYRWSKTSGNQMLHRDAFVDSNGGTLYLPNFTEQDCGTYLCTVESLVGVEDCEVTLSVTSPQTMNYGLKAIAAAVPTMVVVIIAGIIVICFCRRNKQNEELFSNEILEDELSPHRRAQGIAQTPMAMCGDQQGVLKIKDKEMRQQHKTPMAMCGDLQGVLKIKDKEMWQQHKTPMAMCGDLQGVLRIKDNEMRQQHKTPMAMCGDLQGVLKIKDKEMWQQHKTPMAMCGDLQGVLRIKDNEMRQQHKEVCQGLD